MKFLKNNIAFPLTTLALASLGLELIFPGIVSRWIWFPVFFFGTFFLALLSCHSEERRVTKNLGQSVRDPSLSDTAQDDKKKRVAIILALALFSVVVAWSLAGKQAGFLVFTLLATVVVTLSFLRKETL